MESSPKAAAKPKAVVQGSAATKDGAGEVGCDETCAKGKAKGKVCAKLQANAKGKTCPKLQAKVKGKACAKPKAKTKGKVGAKCKPTGQSKVTKMTKKLRRKN